MPGMPYHLEKGGWLSVLEDYLNGAPGRSEAILALLKDPSIRVSDTGFLQSPSLDKDPDYETVTKRVGHLRRDWFGYTGEEYIPDTPQVAFLDQVQSRLDSEDLGEIEFSGSFPTDECDWETIHDYLAWIAPYAHGLRNWPVTGFWVQYFGNVEEIVRQTLIRTIEVSLGLQHGEDVPSGGPRRVLPIELFWKCPQRWFEGWVTWRWDETHGTGQVTTMFATPGVGQARAPEPPRRARRRARPVDPRHQAGHHPRRSRAVERAGQPRAEPQGHVGRHPQAPPRDARSPRSLRVGFGRLGHPRVRSHLRRAVRRRVRRALREGRRRERLRPGVRTAAHGRRDPGGRCLR